MSDAPILQARGLRFAYPGGAEVLGGVDFTARAGELQCVLGPNGSGKTTLLRCLLGRLRPSAGTIDLAGRPLAACSARQLARQVGYVPQFPTSAFAFTAREVVLMARLAHTGPMGLAGEHDRSVADEALRMTDSLSLASRTLEELSGGEAQRVMIARALAQQPVVVLLDEPTSHLDLRNQLRIYQMMRRVAHDWPMAVVCVSHDVNLAGRFADRLVVMKDGAVLAAGSPGEVIDGPTLSRAYDVEIELIPVEGQSTPIARAK